VAGGFHPFHDPRDELGIETGFGPSVTASAYCPVMSMRRAMAVAVLLAVGIFWQAPAGAAPDPAVSQGSATRLYTAYFSRLPDLKGLAYWVGKLQTGTPLRTVSSSFAASSEFKRTYGSLNNDAFVDLIYRNVLGRPGDASGRAYWIGQLNANRQTRGGVMIGFSESNEFVRKTGTTPPRPAATFGDGTRNAPTGTWRNVTNINGCYWERLRGFSGNLSDIIANDFTSTPGRSIVTIASSDVGFSSTRCGTWVPDIGPITLSPTQPFLDGIYRVNRDVSPGRWQASPAKPDDCYWARLKGFSGQLADIVSNDFSTIVDIQAGDAGFSSSRCGVWRKIG
jgi:hypothetical protein